MNKARILSTGHGLPKRSYSNVELAELKNIDTSNDWIVQRTGIEQRYMCDETEGTHSLAIAAGKQALERSGVRPDQIDMIIVGTVSGDYIWPSTACFVQDALGCKNAGAFDVSAACAGFIYSLANATALIESGAIKYALVIGVDALTKQIDWTDRSTCILFGDGAAAVVVGLNTSDDRGVVKTVMYSDGSGANHISMDAGGTKYPPNAPHSEGKKYGIQMKGNEVYRFAVKAMGDACEKVLIEAGIDASKVDLFVPHQANLRIINSAAERFNFPNKKVFVNVNKYGN
ncbi:MAG TPA: beta-ketoacyl-ACP synthase III, partial [Fimbriimonas sp.]|nr:beta-ketoacyl-ACP synthase III [Fimbriimonas sp.]